MYFLHAPSEPECVKWASHDQVTELFCCDEMINEHVTPTHPVSDNALRPQLSTWWYEVINRFFPFKHFLPSALEDCSLVSLLSRRVRIQATYLSYACCDWTLSFWPKEKYRVLNKPKPKPFSTLLHWKPLYLSVLTSYSYEFTHSAPNVKPRLTFPAVSFHQFSSCFLVFADACKHSDKDIT